ncbi:FAD-dependent oxidoreductase [bacterium]|nr:FAD-dependent oxidoreductase [bacterium]
MQSLAIIGTGIAGMGCGYFLHKEFDITVYEQNSYIGGHTNTVAVDENGLSVPIDTGFMVYNDVTYPNLVRLFKELDVKTKNTSMSFSVQHVPTGLEYSGSGLNGLFAQRRNIFSPRFVKMLFDINRFNSTSTEVLNNLKYGNYSLSDYVAEKEYGSDFLHKYLIPMSSAVWSTPPDLMVKFPAAILIRFFYNHGFLGLNTQHQWKTIVNGSQSYRDKLIAPFANRIHSNRQIVKIKRAGNKVNITDASGREETFDKVIVACHGDQAIKLLDQPTEMEQRLLGKFHYQVNTATLHNDASLMPRTKRAWSSWNYRLELGRHGSLVPSTVYYMNLLQHVSNTTDYFVSINDAGNIDASKVLTKIIYEHPIFSLETMTAQKELHKLNTAGPVYFCGSYFGYGFHEDAFTSALDLCRTITQKDIWP